MNENQVVTMFAPRHKAGRIKFQIPYKMEKERKAFKQLNGSFYHYAQRLWSIPNTEIHKQKVRAFWEITANCQSGNQAGNTTVKPF